MKLEISKAEGAEGAIKWGQGFCLRSDGCCRSLEGLGSGWLSGGGRIRGRSFKLDLLQNLGNVRLTTDDVPQDVHPAFDEGYVGLRTHVAEAEDFTHQRPERSRDHHAVLPQPPV